MEHAEGNGSLRAAGLDGDTWHAWLLELVARHAHAQASLFQTFRESRSPGLPNFADPRVQAALRRHGQAGDILAAWPGDARVLSLPPTCLDRWRANTSPTSPLDLDASVERRFERRHRLHSRVPGNAPASASPASPHRDIPGRRDVGSPAYKPGVRATPIPFLLRRHRGGVPPGPEVPATRHDCLGLAGPATSTLVHASVISLARTDTYQTPYSAVALGSRRMERSCPAPGADATQPSASPTTCTQPDRTQEPGRSASMGSTKEPSHLAASAKAPEQPLPGAHVLIEPGTLVATRVARQDGDILRHTFDGDQIQARSSL